MKPQILTILSLLAVTPVFAQDALNTCANITDSTARLACYDEAMQANKALPVLRIPRNTSAPASSTPAPGAVPGTPAVTSQADQPEDGFGLEIKTSDNTVYKNTRNFTLADANYNQFTGWTIEFTNGQVWKQVGADSYRIEPGQTYTISRGTFNSFFLNAAGKRDKIRITRSQ